MGRGPAQSVGEAERTFQGGCWKTFESGSHLVSAQGRASKTQERQQRRLAKQELCLEHSTWRRTDLRRSIIPGRPVLPASARHQTAPPERVTKQRHHQLRGDSLCRFLQFVQDSVGFCKCIDCRFDRLMSCWNR